MIFFSILIVLAILQLWGSRTPIQSDDWLQEWALFLSEKIPSQPLRLILIVIVPMLIIALLDLLFSGVLFGALSLALYVSVLLYSLGRGEFNEVVDQYLTSWRAGNFESAYLKASSIGDFGQSETINDKQELHDKVRGAIVYEGYQRWFAVVFWFLILGPAGALAYRLCYLAGRMTIYPGQSESAANWDEPLQQQALQITHYLDWLPARLLAAAFSITGRFEATAERLAEQFTDNKPVIELLDSCAVAALHDDNSMFLSAEEDLAIEQGEREIIAIQGLLSRSVICWVAAIAILQLIL